VMADFAPWVSWETAATLMNSSFSTSLVGALAGAYAGAKAAQIVAERYRETEQLLGQIRATNAAISATFTICNLLLAFKRQHIQPLFDVFSAQKEELAAFRGAREAGAITKDQIFEFKADLRSVHPPLLPIELLERLLYERLSVAWRPLSLTSALAGVEATLEELTSKRETLIADFRNLPAGEPGMFAALYFGFPYADGHMSTEYADILGGLRNQTDDGIFFSELLCKDLAALGDEALASYKRRVKRTKLRISTVSFDEARAQGLMPDSEQYKDWLKGFQKAPDADQAGRGDVGLAPP
jgi:hypothetical protein